MIDIKFVRDNPEKLKKALKNRWAEFDINYLLELDEKRRTKIKEVDDLRARQNQLSEEIVQQKSYEVQPHKISGAKDLKAKLGNAEFELKALGEEFNELMYKIPNIPDPQTPIGKDENDNKVLREVGKKPKFAFEPKDHLELATKLDILDFETAAKVSGSDFYYLKNEGVLLEMALVRYALDFLAKKGFTPVITPELVRSKFYLGTGYLPRGTEAQTYTIANSDLGLIATAEIALAGIHADEILNEDRLPLRYGGYSHCFRQESGSYGKYSKGLYRVHQFTKVEMFVYCRPEDSSKIHLELLEHEEKLWQGLGIPYRVVEMCTGDLGAQASRKFDLEAWMPGRNDWGEVTSTSNTTDYQARRLNIRCKPKAEGPKAAKADYVHTLNGTAIATSRAIIAILENYQQKDGSVKIPKVLRPYLGGVKVIKR